MIRTVLLHALCVVVLAGGLLPAASAQEAAVTRRATDLRDAPGDKGRSIAALPAQAAVARTGERQGPWVQVRTDAGATGWVHLFDIGPASAAKEGGSTTGNALRGVTGLFGGNRQTQTGSTAGIRGLDAQDLANAQPNPGAVTRMEGLRQSEADARTFARNADLRTATVEALPEPSRRTASPAGNPGQQVAP
ncbi:SH3 domain-containing protein [Ramlibacter sp. PS3R-8]|uniref:SH3 domain-containing protein n=1 Tax=Ramlibacter sp. PS3R-8 TaxID=3133437 RepID=UPI00309A0681